MERGDYILVFAFQNLADYSAAARDEVQGRMVQEVQDTGTRMLMSSSTLSILPWVAR
jgi:hypothetical protein